jgi:CubicO group peptidase (beta-lactamase class C family)
LADILTHQSGIVPTISHWEKTLVKGQIGFMIGPPRYADLPQFTFDSIDAPAQEVVLPNAAFVDALPNTRLSSIIYCDSPDTNWYTHEVSPGLYAMRTIEDTLWKWTLQSKLLPPNKNGGHDYVYSDVGFYLMKRLAEKLLNQPIDEFLTQNFYDPLGLQTLCYNPLRYFDTSAIAPTEFDALFRRQVVRGTVHDPGAALLGGVGGHAGIFSNALDLATIMQMNLQNGYYGGTQFLFPQTLPYFTKKHFARNRRGLGWDKPITGGGGPTSKYASTQTFGHTGFTGTCAWADPKEDLVFVFLSNRVYPDAENKRLINENIRPRLQDIIYRAITDSNSVASQ